MNNKIREKLKLLPTDSGVYIMLDEDEQILYVGKAKNLKNRVRQYFQNSVKTEKTMLLVEKICDFRYIITNSEIEALVLENNLIKEHKPFYNILLKDDKSYPYIKINLKEAYPKIEVTRRLKKDGAKYYGPYMLGLNVKMITELVHSVFPVRSCTRDVTNDRKGKRECLNYHIGRCLAPCVGKTSKDAYKAVIKDVQDFLNGNDKKVKEILVEKMNAAAAREEFELAIKYRESLDALEKLIRKQVANLPLDISIDIFTYSSNGMYGVINYMVVRGGKVLGAENRPVTEAGLGEDILSSYIMQYYDGNPILCNEILTSVDLPFAAELQKYLSDKKGQSVKILKPKAGVKFALLNVSYENASEHLEKTVTNIATKEALTLGSIQQLKELLSLKSLPKRMECYDISNISGVDKVASMVVFINGEPAKEMYRRFKIRTVAGIDDFASMREVISRRLAEMDGEDVSFTDRPNLIVVDGGKGQLSSANSFVESTGIELIGLAKREEEVFFPHISESVMLPRDSLALKVLQRLRDEAHRFAITYHRTLRSKRQTKSNLKNIPGIGEKKARALLVYFKKIDKIAAAGIAELMEVEGIGRKHAEEIYDFYHPKEEE